MDAICRSAVALLLLSVALGPLNASAQFAVLDEPWLSPDNCDAIREPIRMEALDEVTFILRERPCVDREAPFLFLLIGSEPPRLWERVLPDAR